jgi:hypothetical protein
MQASMVAQSPRHPCDSYVRKNLNRDIEPDPDVA